MALYMKVYKYTMVSDTSLYGHSTYFLKSKYTLLSPKEEILLMLLHSQKQ